MQLNAWLRAVAELSPWGRGDTKAPVLWEPSPVPSCPLSSHSGEHTVSRKVTNAHLEKGQMCMVVLTLVDGQVPTQPLSHPPSIARQEESEMKKLMGWENSIKAAQNAEPNRGGFLLV